MFNLEHFISEHVTLRERSLFETDLEDNREKLNEKIGGKRICVIGGAGSIGSSFIRAVLPYHCELPEKLTLTAQPGWINFDMAEFLISRKQRLQHENGKAE